MNLQIDPVDNPQTTRPIQMGSEISIESYPNRQFGSMDNSYRKVGAGSVLTWTWTRRDGPELLLTLGLIK